MMSFAEARAVYVAAPMKPQSSWNLEKPTGQTRAIHSSSLGRGRQRGKGSEMRLKKGTGKERSRKHAGQPPLSSPQHLQPAQTCLHNSGRAGPDKTLTVPVKHQCHLHLPQGHQDTSRNEHLAPETPLQMGGHQRLGRPGAMGSLA